ncbi:MAG: tRNA lysidine(34) synthetase TilS [Betaproteobacteria bacterium]
MPQLEEKFPGAKKSLARAAGHFAEAALLLDELAEIDRAALSSASGGVRLNLDGLNALSHARARNLLRFVWLETGFRAPDTLWIDEALKQLATADSLSEICLSTNDGVLHVYRGELYLIKHYPPAPAEPLLWSGENELPWSGGQVRFVPVTGSGFCRDLLDQGGLSLCSRQGGERLQPNLNRPRRTVRNLLQEQGVPPWERERLPYLWCNDQLVWVGGVGVDTAFACASGEEGMMPVWESKCESE